MNLESEKSENNGLLRPVSFPVGRLGLPLSFNDNLVCALVILLAIALQVRLHNTLLGEGWFALLGFIGYVAIRLWYLRRRYPDPGDLIVAKDEIIVPASLNNGNATVIHFHDLKRVEVFIFKGRHSNPFTSVVLFSGRETVRINWLALELNKLERELIARNIPVTRTQWSAEKYVLAFALICLGFVALILVKAFYW